MKTLKTNPGAKRLMESLRNMGYDSSTAVADLVDNSIVANASEIHIDLLPKSDDRPAAIVISDNGDGMDKDTLHEAMRFGAFQEYSSGDLGKYGLGLKTASLSQGRTLTVSSKAKAGHDVRPRRHCMRWDIDHVYETDDWDLMLLSDDELESWERDILNNSVSQDNGTTVLWTDLDEALPLLSEGDVREREKFLARLIEEISNHLRMVFHRFMQGSVSGHRKLNIYVCGEKLIPWDPFCRQEKTRELDILKMNVISLDPDGSKLKESVLVTPFVLPREDEFSSVEAWKDASGPKNWNQHQGFYFYRNNRLLQAGGWSRLRALDEHTKLLRVAVDFPGELDRAFSINITKMKARIPDEIRDQIGAQVSKWVKTARTRYDGKSPDERRTPLSLSAIKSAGESPVAVNVGPVTFSKNASGRELSVVKDKKTGVINMMIPKNHALFEIFNMKNNSREDLKKLCLASLSLLEAVYEKKIPASHIPMAAIKKIYRSL